MRKRQNDWAKKLQLEENTQSHQKLTPKSKFQILNIILNYDNVGIELVAGCRSMAALRRKKELRIFGGED